MNKKIIASREYHILDTIEVYRVEISVPYPLNDEFKNWRCDIAITGKAVPEGMGFISAGGVDSYQALSLALQMSKGMIEALNKNYLDSKLRFGNDKSGNLGFD